MDCIPVKIENISKVFGKGEKEIRAVDDLSFHIGKGEVVCLLGPNGSGKTTSLKIVCGLIEPDSGVVKILDQDLSKNTPLLKHIGVILEGSRNIYPYLSPLENIKYYARIHGFDGDEMISKAEVLLDSFSLTERKTSPCSTLSLGMQQKVALCCTLIYDPQVLLLDEPTSGLDVLTKRDVIKTIQRMKDEGKSILLMTHQMDVAEKVADRIIVINKGRIIIEGTPKSISQYIESSIYSITLQENASAAQSLLEPNIKAEITDNVIILHNSTQEDISEFIRKLTAANLSILSVTKNLSLEESVIRLMEGAQ